MSSRKMRQALQALEKDNLQSFWAVVPKIIMINSKAKYGGWGDNSILSNQPPIVGIAFYYGAINCLKYLLECKANIKLRDSLGRMAFDFCAGENDDATIRKMIKLHDPMIIDALTSASIPLDCENYSVTHSSVVAGDPEFLEYVLCNGGDINCVWKGMTPLCRHFADRFPKQSDFAALEDIKILLDVSVFEKHFATPLKLIQYNADTVPSMKQAEETNDHLSVFFHLLLGCDFTSHNFGSPLITQLVSFFTTNNDSALAKILMKDNSLLHLAVRYSPLNVVRFLIERGFDIDQRDADGFSPIHNAIKYWRFDVVNLLIEYCASLQPPSPEIPSLCHLLAQNKRELKQQDRELVKEFVNYLIQNGESVDCVDCYGRQPLEYARDTNFTVAEILIRCGAAEV